MPELTPSQRAAGSWVSGQPPAARKYDGATLGGLCAADCGRHVPAALEDDRHATCDPEWAALVAESRRATRANPTRKKAP